MQEFNVIQEDILNKKVWRKPTKNKKGFTEIPLEKLTPKQMQEAYDTSCAKQLLYHNKTMIFDKLVEDIEEIAEKKGIVLKTYDTNFHKQRAAFKKRQNVLVK